MDLDSVPDKVLEQHKDSDSAAVPDKDSGLHTADSDSAAVPDKDSELHTADSDSAAVPDKDSELHTDSDSAAVPDKDSGLYTDSDKGLAQNTGSYFVSEPKQDLNLHLYSGSVLVEIPFFPAE